MAKITLRTLYTILAGLALLGGALAQQPPAKSPTSAPAKTAPGAPAKAQPAATKAEDSQLPNLKDKVSYAIGMNLGASLRRQSVDIDTNLFLQGLKDALGGGKTLMTDEEARATMIQLQTELRAKQEEKQKVAAETNQKEGDAFLAENKTKPGVVALPSGLQYKILTPGTGAKPTAADTVVCNYKGTLINGTEFDASDKHGGPATFPVGGVIKGWTQALQLMPVGSKWQLFIPADLAYGPRGAGPDIGPGATLVFEVELLSIKEKEKEAPAAPAPKPQQ
ncbi:MAG TPA: FKBP-type peptidyl-prolyl cis-trans isomerase [Candidatus Angelobacter sp.]|nr:FKBP-type peptidyl-prolyl cis-trans isomerase [Candidatus Angelobacter sp.]